MSALEFDHRIVFESSMYFIVARALFLRGAVVCGMMISLVRRRGEAGPSTTTLHTRAHDARAKRSRGKPGTGSSWDTLDTTVFLCHCIPTPFQSGQIGSGAPPPHLLPFLVNDSSGRRKSSTRSNVLEAPRRELSRAQISIK